MRREPGGTRGGGEEKRISKYSMENILRDAGRKPVVFAFISYRCGHCKRLLPYLESLCQEMPDVIFKKVDVNTSNDLVQEFAIDGVPDIFLYKNGVLYNRITGANKDLLLSNLTELRHQN
ncbi:thioredoxin-like [Rhinoderma darwinii]|uniref:thioredoxin-like n=1 Tax=Rhinoderma darwinii TaxID=43563 RepID=UPI003F67802B